MSPGDGSSLVNQPIEPSVPRVYTDIDTDSPVGLLSHFKPMKFLDGPLFTAALTRDEASPDAAPERVFMKLVDRIAMRPYGAQVHGHLAARGYAPQLCGHKILRGAPTAYVME